MVSATLAKLRSRADPSPMIEPRSVPIYILLAVGFVVSCALFRITEMTLDRAVVQHPPLWITMLILTGPLARRVGHTSIAGAFETTGLIYGQGIALASAMFPLTALSAPLADASLAQADRLLGFDWVWFVRLFDNPVGNYMVVVTYKSFNWQPAIILPLLFASKLDDRAWRMVTAAIIALLSTLAIYPLCPALGAFYHFGITHVNYPNYVGNGPWEFGPVIEQIKAGARVITPEMLSGLVSFPSYHAVAAVLFVWAMWPVRKLRWFILALNVAMGLSAMIVGAHYLVDLIGGALIALVSIALAPRLTGLVLTSITPTRSA